MHSMKNIDKGTVIRTVLLLVALINQLLIAFGKSPLDVSETQIDEAYTVISTIITAGMSAWAWWKNNNITRKARERAARISEIEKNDLLDEKY